MVRHLVLCMMVTAGLVSVVCAQDEKLRKAVANGDAERVNSLLHAGANVNTKYENQLTPMYFTDNPQMITLLIARGAKLNLRDSASCQSPLEYVAEMHSRDEKRRENWQTIVDMLLAGGAEYTVDTAIYMNDIAFVKEWLDRDDSWVNMLRDAQSVPLRVAAGKGRTEICRLLLDHGADPNDFEQGSGFPIMRDAVDHPEVVKLLIEYKANLRRRITWRAGRTGFWIIGDEATALHFAVQAGQPESVKALIDAGLDPNAADDKGQTPLHLAIGGYFSARQNSHFAQQNGLGPLLRSTEANFLTIIELLLENDASISFKDKSGNSASTLLSTPGERTDVHELLSKKADKLNRAYHDVWFKVKR